MERIHYPADNAKAVLLLAHGAGAGNRHEFMDTYSKQLASKGIEVISFNFPYMQMAYELEKKRPPNSNKQLIAHFQQELALIKTELPIFIAGKSMGGRVATQIMAQALEQEVKACIVLGYPFIPPGKPEKLTDRMAHFNDIQNKVLILQGERDIFGGLELLSKTPLPKTFELVWVTSGDHSFKPLKSSGLNSEQNIEFAAQQTADFVINNI